MALVLAESFAGSTTIANFQNNHPTRRWANSTWCTIQTAIGPRSTYGMRIAFDGVASGVASWGLDLRSAGGLGPLASGGVLGARMSFSSVSSGQYGAISFTNSDTSAIEWTVQRASNGTVNLRRGDGSTGIIVASSSAGAIPADTFGFLEVKWNTISTTANVTVRWNSTAIITATGVNIQGGTGTHTVGGIGWFGRTDTQDLYLIDLSGAAPLNDFLGDAQVRAALPTAAAATGWAVFPSGSNLSLINDNTGGKPTSSAFTKATSAAIEDRFTFGAWHPTNRRILAAITRTCAFQTGGSGTMANRLKSGATTTSGATVTPPTLTPTYQTDIWTTDPNTSAAWLPSAINALELGYRSLSVPSGEVRSTQVLLETLSLAGGGAGGPATFFMG